MRLTARVLLVATALAVAMISPAKGQAPASTPAPEPAPAAAPPAPPVTPPPLTDTLALPAPAPAAPAVLRIKDVPSIAIEKLPADNPFGSTPEVPAALPAKLPFTDATLSTGFFVSVHVDATGKPLVARRDRDPIPSLAAETLKSLARWVFSPGRHSGQPVDTWGAYRLDLEFEIRAPKILQMGLTPVLPASAIPKPFEWPPDADWLDSRHAEPPAAGTFPIDQVDTAPIPQKTPWSADSFKGPFSVKYWLKVDKAGKITRAIPLEVSDPVLLPYFRKAMASWMMRPAQSGGAPVDSWNELTLSGQVSFSDEIKQILALKRPIGP